MSTIYISESRGPVVIQEMSDSHLVNAARKILQSRGDMDAYHAMITEIQRRGLVFTDRGLVAPNDTRYRARRFALRLFGVTAVVRTSAHYLAGHIITVVTPNGSFTGHGKDWPTACRSLEAAHARSLDPISAIADSLR